MMVDVSTGTGPGEANLADGRAANQAACKAGTQSQRIQLPFRVSDSFSCSCYSFL